MPRVISGVHHPILRLLGRVEQPLESHLRRSLRRYKAQRRGGKRHNKHHRRQTQNCHSERSDDRFLSAPFLRGESAFASCTHRHNFHWPPPFSLAASRNAMRSFRSFSARLLASYAGIKDSRVFSKECSLAFSNACNSSRVSNI